MTDFIFMLTHDDRTVENAREAIAVALKAGVRHIGFKDIGVDAGTQRELTRMITDAGATSYLEVVSVTRAEEIKSVGAGVEAGVDWVLGGTNASEVASILRGSRIGYAPFCGHIVGHPSVLEGSISEIAASAASLTAINGVVGVDLLAYRHKTADIAQLIQATVSSSEGPVIVAGSVTNIDQVKVISEAGATGFTIGSAIFDGHLDAPTDLRSQLDAAVRYAEATQ